MSYWVLALQSPSEGSGVHRESIFQSGSCLGSVRVHSSHFPTPLGACGVIPGLPFGLQPCKPLCLGRKPKVRVTIEMPMKRKKRFWICFEMLKEGYKFWFLFIFGFQVEYNVRSMYKRFFLPPSPKTHVDEVVKVLKPCFQFSIFLFKPFS